jgi:hypothetical protein
MIELLLLSTVSSSLLAQIHLHRLLLAPSWPEKTRETRHSLFSSDGCCGCLCKPTLLTYLLSSIIIRIEVEKMKTKKEECFISL